MKDLVPAETIPLLLEMDAVKGHAALPVSRGKHQDNHHKAILFSQRDGAPCNLGTLLLQVLCHAIGFRRHMHRIHQTTILKLPNQFFCLAMPLFGKCLQISAFRHHHFTRQSYALLICDWFLINTCSINGLCTNSAVVFCYVFSLDICSF